MCDCDFLPHYFIWSTEDTQQLYPNRLVGSSCVYKSVFLPKRPSFIPSHIIPEFPGRTSSMSAQYVLRFPAQKFAAVTSTECPPELPVPDTVTENFWRHCSPVKMATPICNTDFIKYNKTAFSDKDQ